MNHLCRQHRFHSDFLVSRMCVGVVLIGMKRLAGVDIVPLEMEPRDIFWSSILVSSIVSAVLHWSLGGSMIKEAEEDEHRIET